ncbi:proteoglycan 3-like [Leptodactylus fuscus]|uniref:proteoglycan 3-like n=1 Tax=Leptodactylus fuscus TaxID=238119 RepID=UPI003F4EF989
MLRLLLLLLVGIAFAQESGDDVQENFVDKLKKVADDDGDNIQDSVDGVEGEDETEDDEEDDDQCDEKDLSLTEENHQLEPNFSEKAEASECPDKGSCGYHVFCRPRFFRGAQCFCRRRRGNLSSIHNNCANHHLAGILRRTISNSAFVWIGVIKRCRHVPYRNVDGSCLNYTNWACGNPKRRRRWCVAMNRFTGQWVSLRCKTRLPFVCTY